MDDQVGVADTSVIGDEILIVRVSADVTQEAADKLADEIRKVVAKHGSGFAVVVVRAGHDCPSSVAIERDATSVALSVC